MVRVRFAPSPTGFLHIGNIRTALFNYLFAHKEKGKFILRIEDTDPERNKKTYIEQIYSDLKWLGLEWDEGPDLGGDFGPYQQSQRLDIYREYVKKLINEKKAYYCFCSEEELEERRQEALAQSKTPRYDNRCRDLTESEIHSFKSRGVVPAVRFKIEEKELSFVDLIRGEVKFDLGLFDDFIILRPNSLPTFHLAVSLDDGLMKITHVIRGEDHLTNTPRHILIFKAFGFEPPQFAHLPLLVGKEGEPLSKRSGVLSIAEYKRCGYLPPAILNALSLLGWSAGGDREIFSLEELKKEFSLEKISKSPSLFDKDKLNWVNGQHIRALSDEQYIRKAYTYLVGEELITDEDKARGKEWFEKFLLLFKDNIEYFYELTDRLDMFATDEAIKNMEILQREGSREIISLARDFFFELEKIEEDTCDKLVETLSREVKQRGKDLFLPLRVALTCRGQGPELKKIFPLLSKKLCLKRLEQALEFVR